MKLVSTLGFEETLAAGKVLSEPSQASSLVRPKRNVLRDTFVVLNLPPSTLKSKEIEFGKTLGILATVVFISSINYEEDDILFFSPSIFLYSVFISYLCSAGNTYVQHVERFRR